MDESDLRLVLTCLRIGLPSLHMHKLTKLISQIENFFEHVDQVQGKCTSENVQIKISKIEFQVFVPWVPF